MKRKKYNKMQGKKVMGKGNSKDRIGGGWNEGYLKGSKGTGRSRYKKEKALSYEKWGRRKDEDGRIEKEDVGYKK